MYTGKAIRLERIFNRNTNNAIIVPMDHGVSVGPIAGLEDLRTAVNKVADGGANAVLGHIGLAKYGHRGFGRDIGLILHLSGSTSLAPDPNHKVLVKDVEEAIKFGADAVSVHVNIGAQYEAEMLATLGRVSAQCDYWGIPLLAMMYPRGPKVEDEHDAEYVKLAARVGAELGADIVKTNYTGDVDSFKEVIKGCPVPVVVAGGPQMDTELELLQMVRDSLDAGGSGVAIGRNIFQARDPTAVVRQIARVVHEGYDAHEAMRA